jgi:hypothetical protein
MIKKARGQHCNGIATQIDLFKQFETVESTFGYPSDHVVVEDKRAAIMKFRKPRPIQDSNSIIIEIPTSN